MIQSLARPTVNRRIVLAERPRGEPVASDRSHTSPTWATSSGCSDSCVTRLMPVATLILK